jgi:hypothetical protein
MNRSINAITKTFIKEGKLSYSQHDTGGLTYLGMAYKKWPNALVWPKIFKIIQSVRPDLNDNILKTVGMGGPVIKLTTIEESKINSLLEPLRKDIILFYKNEFWDAINADGIISQTFAESFFDFSVNVGTPTGAKILQRYLGVKDDGAIGNITLGKLNGELLKNTYNVHIDFTILKVKRYVEIISKNSKQLANFHGWLNRTFQVFDEVFDIEIVEKLTKSNPGVIPAELKNDISKLLEIYNLNNKYSLNRTASNLQTLYEKISETIK